MKTIILMFVAAMCASAQYYPGDSAGAPQVYPGAGIPVSTGSAWSTSLTTASGLQGVTFAASVPSLTALGTAALVSTGTSGGTVPLLNGANTWSGINTHTAAILLAKTPAAANCTGSALANCGTFSVGGGPFDGSTAGKFVGSSSGTSIAVNEASGYGGNLMDLQVAGVSEFKVSAGGAISLNNIRPLADSNAAITLTNAAGSGNMWKIDTTNGYNYFYSLGSNSIRIIASGSANNIYYDGTSGLDISSAGGGLSVPSLLNLGGPGKDTSLSRDSAGVIDFGTGAQGSTAGSWKATNGTLSGTLTYTGPGAAANTVVCYKAGGVLGWASNTAGVIGTTCN